LALPALLELAPEPDALAADVREDFAPCVDRAQAFHEERVARLYTVEHLRRVDYVEDRFGDRTGERIAPVSRAMYPDRERARYFGGRQHRADREAAAEPLGAGQDVGYDTLLHVGEQCSSAAHAALDLVEDEQSVVIVAQPARGREEFRRAGD